MKQKEIFKNMIDALIKAEYIDNLAYAFNYTEKIFVPSETEKIEVTFVRQDGQEDTRQEPKMELVDNPKTKIDFVIENIFDYMNTYLNEKIKEGGAIKLEVELEEANKKIKDIF